MSFDLVKNDRLGPPIILSLHAGDMFRCRKDIF